MAGVKNGQYVSDRCERCMGQAATSAEFANKYRRDRDREDYRRDIIQKYDEDFAKVYGADRAREAGWSEEDIRKYG